jgi:glutaredoxin-related protein
MRGHVMTKLLSQEQINQYDNSGFVSPIDVLNQDEIRQSLKEIENFEEKTGKPIDFPHKSRCHQLFS